MAVEAAGQRLDQRVVFETQLLFGEIGKGLWVPFTVDEGLHHRPTGYPEDVGSYHGQLHALLTELPDRFVALDRRATALVVTVPSRDWSSGYTAGSVVAGRAPVRSLVSTGDLFEPYQLVDADGVIVVPVAAFLRDLQACGRSASTLRSYGMDLLRWFRFVWSIEIGWDRTTSVEARDFCCWLQLADKPSGPHWRRRGDDLSSSSSPDAAASRRRAGAPNTVTGKPTPGAGYASTTRARSRERGPTSCAACQSQDGGAEHRSVIVRFRCHVGDCRLSESFDERIGKGGLIGICAVSDAVHGAKVVAELFVAPQSVRDGILV